MFVRRHWPNCCRSSLRNSSPQQFDRHFIKPFLQHVKNYVRDDIDVLTHLPEHIIEETLLLSFDVTNLYTNISHSLGLEAVMFWQVKFSGLIHRRFNKIFILKIIKLILQNNNFKFDDAFNDQIWGTAMGTKFAPTYATLVSVFL